MDVPKDQGTVHDVAGVVGWPGSDPVSLVLGLETIPSRVGLAWPLQEKVVFCN